MFTGAWPSQPDDGNLINSSDLSWSREVFAVGDELGYIRLFRFPCSQPGVSGLLDMCKIHCNTDATIFLFALVTL